MTARILFTVLAALVLAFGGGHIAGVVLVTAATHLRAVALVGTVNVIAVTIAVLLARIAYIAGETGWRMAPCQRVAFA